MSAVPENSDAARIHPNAKGLPAVTPPSGRFIAQLFLVPGLIVLVAVLLLMAFSYTLSSGNTPERFLDQLDSTNADIRWRAASDLAQVLKRAEGVQLKANTKFALDLAQRLRSAMDELTAEEKKTQEKADALSAENEKKAAWRKLQGQRDHVMFLAASLGDFHVPVGVPLLSEIVLREEGPDVKATTQRRRQALWALANLGENVKGFAKLSAEQRAAALAELTKEAEGDSGRAAWARTALYYLDPKPSTPDADVVQVDRVLAQAAKADDRFLREQVAVALNFWDGPLVEPTLLLLSRDDGHGTVLRLDDENDLKRP
ncbi:MAG: hypothetical protein HY040_06165 [Planctomycetes bacterium]|nr:hypothetical protein [Planctomycetota bacterium]